MYKLSNYSKVNEANEMCSGPKDFEQTRETYCPLFYVVDIYYFSTTFYLILLYRSPLLATLPTLLHLSTTPLAPLYQPSSVPLNSPTAPFCQPSCAPLPVVFTLCRLLCAPLQTLLFSSAAIFFYPSKGAFMLDFEGRMSDLKRSS